MTIAAHTLGCKLNFAETSHLVSRFLAEGWKQADFADKADLYVINTCTVTAIAEKKCRNAIRQAVTANPDAIVAVVGCFAQNAADEIARIPGVSIILGNDRKYDLMHYVKQHLHNQALKQSSTQAIKQSSTQALKHSSTQAIPPRLLARRPHPHLLQDTGRLRLLLLLLRHPLRSGTLA